MKRLTIIFVLLTIFICYGCGSSDKSAESKSDTASPVAESVTEETPAAESVTEEAPVSVTEESVAEDAVAGAEASATENIVGIFEGLEDNHTAIFSFDGAEKAFYFEDPAVQSVLSEAIIGSSYTLSYSYDDSLGNIINKISE